MTTKPKRVRSVTPADAAAAKRLRDLWGAAVQKRKAEGDAISQSAMAEVLSRYTGKGSQGAISQYLMGAIALNYKATLAFAEYLECTPDEIRNDLPEQTRARAVAHSEQDGRTPAHIVNQLENDVDALSYAVASLFASLATERPGEGARLAEAMSAEIPARFAQNGLVKKLIAALRKGVRKAAKNPRASSP